jgi:hypothetical protein
MTSNYDDIDMYLEEKLVYEEIYCEDSKPDTKSSKSNKKNDNKSKSFADKKKDFENNHEKLTNAKEKTKGVAITVKNLIASVYKMKDDDFVEGKFFPTVSRMLVRGAAVCGVFACGGPIAGCIAFTANSAIKKAVDMKQRKRLMDYYDTKSKWLEEKIGKEDNDKTKYELMKMKKACDNASFKLHNRKIAGES